MFFRISADFWLNSVLSILSQILGRMIAIKTLLLQWEKDWPSKYSRWRLAVAIIALPKLLLTSISSILIFSSVLLEYTFLHLSEKEDSFIHVAFSFWELLTRLVYLWFHNHMTLSLFIVGFNNLWACTVWIFMFSILGNFLKQFVW
jgi:hypothetical protein